MHAIEHVRKAEDAAKLSGYDSLSFQNGDAAEWMVDYLAEQLQSRDEQIDQLEIENQSMRATLCEVSAAY